MVRRYAWECRCPSWAELLDKSEHGKPTSGDRMSRTEGSYWTGTSSWDAAQSLALHGDRSMAERIEAFSARFVSLLISKIQLPEPRYYQDGIQVDVGRYLDGDPECMIYIDEAETETSAAHGKTIFISYNRMASGGYDDHILAARGATIAALVRLLELAGFRVAVEIYGGSGHVSTYGDNAKAFIVSALVKDYDQDLSLPVMAYAIANPSSYRRHLFSLYEQAPKSVVAVTGRYGACFDLPADEITARRIDLHIGSADASTKTVWTDEKQATEWILSQLETMGVSLKETP